MNALMRLNQIRPGLQYRLLSQSGPVHAPVFTMSVDLDGTIYEASGSSKKTAKLHVAVKVRNQVKEREWTLWDSINVQQISSSDISIWFWHNRDIFGYLKLQLSVSINVYFSVYAH